MIAKTLQRLIDEEVTSAREISELAGVSASTVYRWIAGHSQPSFDSIRLLMRHVPSTEAQGAILEAFSAGTAWRFQHLNTDLDVNADGRVDPDDALDASIQAVRSSGEALVKIREACADDRITQQEVGEVIKVLNEVVHQCSITQQVLVRVWEQTDGRRRKLTR